MKTQSNAAVLVAGATGLLGSEICRQLRAQNKPVRGLVRKTSTPEKISALEKLGVEIVRGDLKDRTSLSSALKGINAVVSTVSSTVSRQEGDSIESVDDLGQINLINAAKEEAAEKFVFISFCNIHGKFPLQDVKRKVENHLESSGLKYAILQPGPFMDVWLSPALGFDYVNKKARIFGNGKNKTSWIASKDVAAFAVLAIDRQDNTKTKLGGPDALSQLEVVELFESATGEKFKLEFFPDEALEAQKAAAQDSLSASFAGLMMGISHGCSVDMDSSEIPFPLTSVNEYVKSSLSLV